MRRTIGTDATESFRRGGFWEVRTVRAIGPEVSQLRPGFHEPPDEVYGLGQARQRAEEAAEYAREVLTGRISPVERPPSNETPLFIYGPEGELLYPIGAKDRS
jgi:hypothetical protein